MTTIEPLRDGHGRRIRDVRVSVTDRCNFRCQYCMPAEGLPWLERDAVLSFEELERTVGLLASMGVHDVRLTGGGPPRRPRFPRPSAVLPRGPRGGRLLGAAHGLFLAGAPPPPSEPAATPLN